MPQHDKFTAAVIIPAAGSGSRMGAGLPKQFLTISGIPILALAVSRFLDIPAVGVIAIAVPADHYQAVRKILDDHLRLRRDQRLVLVTGGASRQESVRAAFLAIDSEADIMLVHDGARPFVTREIIDNCLAEAVRSGAAIAAVRVGDTIKRADGPGRRIMETVDRRDLWQAQTPQAARADLLRTAYRLADEQGFAGTDEASLLENAGIPVHIVEGSELNIKITRPDDLILAEGLEKIGHVENRIRL